MPSPRIDVDVAEPSRVYLRPVHALLIHSDGHAHHATLHDVATDDDGRATILPGRLPDRETIAALAGELAETGLQAGGAAWIEPRVLAVGMDRTVWYAPPRLAPMFFATPDKTLMAVSGKTVPYPGLVFHASPRQLRVFALKSRRRPGRGTPLFQAPVYNVSSDGAMCPGSVALPETTGPEVIGDWEETFYRSAFSHSHATRLVTAKGGHDALWKRLARTGAETFPVDALVPLGITVAHLLR